MSGSPRRSPCGSACLCLFLLVVTGANRLLAQSDAVTIVAPDGQEYSIALDELELEPADASRVLRGSDLNLPGALTVTAAERQRAIVRAAAATRGALVELARDLEARNPGTRANLVLYEAGRRRSDVTRRVLTREVAVLFEAGADARGLVGTITVAEPRAVPGVDGAFIVEAAEPLDAIDLATSLRSVNGVKAAYPLLRAKQFLR